MNPQELAERLRVPLERAGLKVNMDILRRVTPLVQERIKLLTDVVAMAGFFFRDDVTLTSTPNLISKKMTARQTRDALQRAFHHFKAFAAGSHTGMEEVLR